MDQPSKKKSTARLLKFCLLATGCAGLVAEYVLSTLATYILGNAVLQWTVVISLMLFAMGLGSRLSRYFIDDLLDKFIFTELALSLLCGACATICYSLYGHITAIGQVVYLLSFAVGILIGLEIPLVTRINHAYEELRLNISSVMEYDYFGALIGGFFFHLLRSSEMGLELHPPRPGGRKFFRRPAADGTLPGHPPFSQIYQPILFTGRRHPGPAGSLQPQDHPLWRAEGLS